MRSPTLAVVQARMGSSRLPGKVVAEVAGVPMLRFMLDRLVSAPLDEVVVATSTDPRDDQIVDIADTASVSVVRGPQADVLARFRQVLDLHPAATVVRLTGDCPFVDPTLIGLALDRHLAANASYTSNTLVRTFPDGLDVEVIAAHALLAADAEASDRAEREHVTPFVYRRPERFDLAAFVSEEYLGDERWTVDTPDDLEFVRTVVTTLGRRDFSWRDVLSVAPPTRSTEDRIGLRPTRLSTPSVRRWTLVLADGVHVGEVVLMVRTGQGVADLHVAPEHALEAERLLRERLTADAQVVALTIRR